MKRWLFRCAPILSTCLLAAILIFTFLDPIEYFSPRVDGSPKRQPKSFYQPKCRKTDESDPNECLVPLSPAQFLFVLYNFMVHCQMSLFCPQLCVALWWITKNMRKVRQRRSQSNQNGFSFGSSTPTKSTGSLPMYKDDEALNGFPGSGLSSATTAEDKITHVVILPNYMEDMGTLRETLMVLASHRKARSQYEIYLAMEEKESASHSKASDLINEFGKQFYGIKATFHPYGIPGEMAGKSSNVSWAAREIMRDHRHDSADVVVTVMDADTHFLDDYFSEIRSLHIQHPHDNQEVIYHCPVLFDRNANSSPVLVRTADMTWIWSSISGLFPGNLISIPMSVYSLPLRLVEHVDGWDADPTAIGEDMHMLLKCYFATQGGLTTRTVFSAASQCNIEGNGGKMCGVDTSAIRARYKQGLRHLWGSLDSGYALRKTFEARRIHNLKHVAILHMIWQAHFMLPHFILMLLGSQALVMLVGGPANVHPTVMASLNWSDKMRLISFGLFNMVFFFHESYHTVATHARRTDMAAARLSCNVERRTWWKPRHLAERAVFPVVGFLFGILPSFVAQTSHLWTEQMVYVPSAKPKVDGLRLVAAPLSGSSPNKSWDSTNANSPHRVDLHVHHFHHHSRRSSSGSGSGSSSSNEWGENNV